MCTSWLLFNCKLINVCRLLSWVRLWSVLILTKGSNTQTALSHARNSKMLTWASCADKCVTLEPPKSTSRGVYNHYMYKLARNNESIHWPDCTSEQQIFNRKWSTNKQTSQNPHYYTGTAFLETAHAQEVQCHTVSSPSALGSFPACQY